MFLDHTQRRNTVGRSPPDEWSARRRDLYLTTHDTHNRQISMPPVGFEPMISAGDVASKCLYDKEWYLLCTVHTRLTFATSPHELFHLQSLIKVFTHSQDNETQQGAWIFVNCECRVLSGRGLCDELITRPEESYRLCCVVVCDLETSRMGAPYIYIYITLVA